MKTQDKLEILFPDPKDVFKMFHIDFNTGYIYLRKFWDQNIKKRTGRPTTGNLYQRVSVTCPHLSHIFKRGHTDVLAHRLIYYAYTGETPEKVDHSRKDVKYPDAISNLTTSDSVHNRWNTKKIKRKKISSEESANTSPSAHRQKNAEEYRGVFSAYNYYWAKFAGETINENGFISLILAVNCRNEYLKKEFFQRYGSLHNFPENALDIIDEQELYLEQMTQEELEKTEKYKLEQEKIRQKRLQMAEKRKIKNKISVKVEDDPFDCIGKYDT